MGRGSTQILIRKIIECLMECPKTISEIVEATGIDRTSVGKYTNLLKDSNLLIEEQDGTSKKFTIVPTYRTDTYFGLPLNQETEQQSSSVFHLIRKNWNNLTSRRLLSTHAQKIAFKVISNCGELKIPHGWYIYGGISIATYDDSQAYNYYGLPKTVENYIKEVTEEYAKNTYAWQSKKLQYEGATELYTIKEEVFSILFGPTFDKDPKRSLYIFLKKLRKLISLAPKTLRKEYNEILDTYQDLMLDISNKLDNKIILEHKREIILLFEAIWKYIALFNFKHDLLNYYSEKILDIHFKLDIKQQEDETIELGTELQSLVPEEEITDQLRKKLYEALDNIKTPSPEEQKKQKEDLDKLKKKLGEEKFKEWLFNEAGLK